MAPVAAAISISQDAPGATKSKIQFIASSGPATKPSSDIDLFTTTLPVPVLVSLIALLRRTLGLRLLATLELTVPTRTSRSRARRSGREDWRASALAAGVEPSSALELGCAYLCRLIDSAGSPGDRPR
jgi:hypothetical protein